MSRISFLFVLTLISFSLEIRASVVALYTELFPPYNYVEQDELKGINVELITQACQRAKIRCNIAVMPWNRAVQLAQSNKHSGVFSTSRTPDREAQFLWVGPLVYSNTCFYKLKTRKDIQINQQSDLLNYTVGIARGDIYQALLDSFGMQQGKHYLTFNKKHQDSRMFKLGKLDLLIGSSITLERQLAEVQLVPDDVMPVYELKDARLKGNYLALNNEFNIHTAAALQAAIDELKQEGALAEILMRYLGEQENSSTDVKPYLKHCLNRIAKF